MSNDLRTLQDNFQEIYHAAHNSETGNLALVANYSGTRIYDATKGWGRLWSWFYQLASPILGKTTRLEKIKTAIEHTQTIFNRHLCLITSHVKEYENYLHKLSKGYEVSELQIFSSRSAITSWNAATKPFIKLLKDVKYENLRQIFNFSLGNPDFHRFKIVQKIINFEGILHAPLPLEVFEKGARGKKLSDSDFKLLRHWIQSINYSGCTLHCLHGTLQAIIEELNLQQLPDCDAKADLLKLEILLQANGCKLFEKEDPKYMRWRESLQKGAEIPFNGSYLILGEQIGKKVVGIDHFLVFEIQNNPHHVLIVGHHQSALALRQEQHRLEQTEKLDPIPFVGIYDEGRWALMPKLTSLPKIKWVSTGRTIAKEDEKYLRPISELVKWFVEGNYTPQNFSPNSLMFDSAGQIKLLKPAPKGPFDFNALQDFILRCAAGNLTVFQYLMTLSGLDKHACAKFYQQIIAHALQGKMAAPHVLAGIYAIGDHKIVDRGAVLQQEVVNSKNRCITALAEHFPDKTPNELEKVVSDLFIQKYVQSKAAGILWPNFEDELVQNYITTAKVPLFPVK